MKPETNNEMDLLLRRLGRSAADSAQDHLDADELSSYAENALPAAARARYTEHLAECGSCRKLVAQLSSSAGVVHAVETVKVSGPSALKKFLASLFAPMVLRYAAPALGLIVVAVIGFTVLRRNESPDSVAQLKEPEVKTPIVQPQPAESPASGLLADNRAVNGPPAAAPEPRREQTKEAQPAPSQTPPASGVAGQANEAAPVTKEEQPPPAEPKPAVATDEVQKKKAAIEAPKQEITDRSVSELPRVTAADASKREDRRSDNGFTPSRPAATTQAGSVANLQRDGARDRVKLKEKDKNDDAETRSAAGRRFRREDGVWIDTAYDSSRNTVNLTRDSEQYRALVADEPAIKTIAEQLDGEIIVVWKSRAYRIR